MLAFLLYSVICLKHTFKNKYKITPETVTEEGTLLEEGIISMGLSQKVKGVFNHKGWFQWTFNFMLRKII